MNERLNPSDLAYFRRGETENPRFWRRFGGQPDFRGASVLDVGCGHGSMSIYLAEQGAAEVVGLDLNERLIEFANANLEQNFPHFADRVAFLCLDLKDYPLEPFDYIVSKDTFEHVLDLPGLLEEMSRRLRAGGRVYAGFGPLYNSPFGDHNVVRPPFPIPWAHLLLGDQRVIRRVNRRRREKVSAIQDLGMNRLALADYRRIFEECDLEVVSFQTNRSDKLSGKTLHALSKLPRLEEYFTFNIYCVLEKT
ncbi:MAG: class I SAM-dependent methyltransferase [Chloroflexi bacterium]|nr:class I SAM-dependent methyltransferase [Chloroflexota bacterium]